MKMHEIEELLGFSPLTVSGDLAFKEIKTAYMSDLLSCVMSRGGDRSLWITLISNINIIAVAKLLDIPVIIITEDAMPDTATIERAKAENVSLFSTSMGNFEVAGKLWDLGIRS